MIAALHELETMTAEVGERRTPTAQHVSRAPCAVAQAFTSTMMRNASRNMATVADACQGVMCAAVAGAVMATVIGGPS